MKKRINGILIVLLLSSCSNFSNVNVLPTKDLIEKSKYLDEIVLNSIYDTPFLYENDYDSLNPFEKEKPVISSDWNYDWYAREDEYLSKIFPHEEYEWYQNICLEEKFALGAKRIDEHIEFRFLKYTDYYYVTPNAHLMPFYFEETYIVNNDIVSYCYDINLTNNKIPFLENENFLKFFSLIINTDKLPYDIYFNNDYLLLMSTNKDFSNTYIQKLNEDGSFYYLDKKIY